VLFPRTRLAADTTDRNRHYARVTWREEDLWDPSNPANKERTRALGGELRRRLLAWDPMGVADAPEAQDEYDSLISPLMHRLHDGMSEGDIAEWLIHELDANWGLHPVDERERRLVTDLNNWWATATREPPQRT
jgi:hypothetical protein